jgi:hypothetical protein
VVRAVLVAKAVPEWAAEDRAAQAWADAKVALEWVSGQAA